METPLSAETDELLGMVNLFDHTKSIPPVSCVTPFPEIVKLTLRLFGSLLLVEKVAFLLPVDDGVSLIVIEVEPPGATI